MQCTRLFDCRWIASTALLTILLAACSGGGEPKLPASSSQAAAAAEELAAHPAIANAETAALAVEGDAAPKGESTGSIQSAEHVPNAPPVSVDLRSYPTDRRLLAWKFAPGNVFRYRVDVVERSGPNSGAAQNQRGYVCRWEVVDVAPEGQSTLTMLIERVWLDLVQPRLSFDSADSDAATSALADPAIANELDSARRLLRTRVLVEVSPQGEISHYSGSSIGVPHSTFLPQDFPRLLSEPVAPLDSWPLPLHGRPSTLTPCTYRKEQPGGGRSIAVLECGPPMAATDGDPLHLIARFDVDAGRFLSSTEKHADYEVRRQLLSSKSTAAFTKFRVHEAAER